MIKSFVLSVLVILLTVSAANAQIQAIDVAAAKKEGKVVVYGSVVPQAMEELHKGFEKKYDIKVEYWRGSSTAVAERAQTEWRAGRPAFDVVESSWDVMILMKKEGLFARYVPPSSENSPSNLKKRTLSSRRGVFCLSAFSTTPNWLKPARRRKISRIFWTPNGRARSAFPIPHGTRRRRNFSGTWKNSWEQNGATM